MANYSIDWYRAFQDHSRQWARKIVPILLELTDAESVVDVGCGLGAWLSVYQEHGIKDILGIDGEYVPRDQLLIAPDCFVGYDLEQPLSIARRFDLAMCLEVAEHLPASCAAALVRGLTQLAPIIYFSAAIPGQGGRGHVNEQWLEYWRDLFARHEYVPIDAVRHRIWQTRKPEYWYAQNGILYAERAVLESNELLRAECAATQPDRLSFVHPVLYSRTVDSLHHTCDYRLRGYAKTIKGLTKRIFGCATT